MTLEERKPFDEAIANAFSNPLYANSYLFYAHLIGQCRVVFDSKMKAPAGVNFQLNHYNLYINPIEFGKFPLEHRLGVLKHEMLHILYGHVARKEHRNHLAFNYATDCAINQLIERGTPSTITKSLKEEVKSLLSDPSKQAIVSSMQFNNLQELHDYLIAI